MVMNKKNPAANIKLYIQNIKIVPNIFIIDGLHTEQMDCLNADMLSFSFVELVINLEG